MNREATYINCMTGNAPSGASIPITFDNDRKALTSALGTVGLVEPEEAKVVRIHDTLDLREVLASEAYRPEVESRSDLSLVEPPGEFDGVRFQRRSTPLSPKPALRVSRECGARI